MRCTTVSSECIPIFLRSDLCTFALESSFKWVAKIPLKVFICHEVATLSAQAEKRHSRTISLYNRLLRIIFCNTSLVEQIPALYYATLFVNNRAPFFIVKQNAACFEKMVLYDTEYNVFLANNHGLLGLVPPHYSLSAFQPFTFRFVLVRC